MKKPYFHIKAICVVVFMLLQQTSFAQEVETQQETNTEQTNSTEGVVRNSTTTYGETGGTGTDDDAFFPNPLLDDILTSTSSTTSKSFNVDKSTGKINVKVPIATVGPDDLKIPIELEYVTGGVKVRDIASWVGLGWDLSAGGKITRVMRRFPDKLDHSLDTLLDINTWKASFFIANGENNFDTRLKNNDTQPDLFYFEIPGKSGLFAFDKDNKAHTIPYQNVKINYDIPTETFEIIDEQGNRYCFDDTEHTRIHEPDDVLGEKDINYKSVWYLSSAQSITGDYVAFEYKHLDNQRKYFHATKNKTLNFRAHMFVYDKSTETYSTDYETYVDPLYLTKISWNNGSVKFISTADREDIQDQQAFKLNSIKLYAGVGEGILIKSYNFEYSTFLNNNKALKLDKINVSSPKSTTQEFYRKFDYCPITGVGSDEMVNEYQIDHWGYYNGPGYRTGIPITKIYEHPQINSNIDKYVSETTGDDHRTPVLVHTLANSLQRIWVTRSGYDEFEYELNTRSYIPNPNIPDSIIIENVGGLRIKSIVTNSTELGNASRKVRYTYAHDNCASSGVVFNIPNYYFLSSIENSDNYYFTIMDSPIRPLFDLDGSHIRYAKVKEIFDNGSSNTYYYTTKKDNPDKSYIAYNITRRDTLTDTELAIQKLDFAPHNTQFWKRGLLTKKISLDPLGNETRLETFEYNTNTNVKGRIKGIFPFTSKMIVYINTDIPPGKPGDYDDGIPREIYRFDDIYLAEYEYQSQPIYMTKKIVKGIDIPETTISYSYGNYNDAVLLQNETTLSGNVSYSTKYKYPLDYLNITGTEEGNATQFMRANNLLSVPIEVVKYKNDHVIGGELYLYANWKYMYNGSITGGTYFNLREVKELLLKKPILASAFRESVYTGAPQGYRFLYDNNYVTKAAYEYNYGNKLGCVKERNKPSQSVIYDDSKTLPIAQTTNAEAKIISGAYHEEVLHTSFEDDNGREHSKAKTGSKVLNGSYYIYTRNLVPGIYAVSYWVSKNDGVDWELYEHEMEVIANEDREYRIGGSGIIDELRVHKKDAQMQTKTYDLSKNVTSETDENGKTTYYEYDAFGRLITVLDNNHDKIKAYDYFLKK